MGFRQWKYNTAFAGIIYLHLTLWTALITLTLSIAILAHAEGDEVLVPCAVLLFAGSIASFLYVGFHEYQAHKRIRKIQTQKVFSAVRRPVYVATRLSIALAMLWLVASGWNMIIAARQPVCLSSSPLLKPWQMEGTCKAQRAGAAFAIINLLTACAFFMHMATTRDPFDIHLLGKFKDRPITWAPYRFSRASGEKPTLMHNMSDSSGESWSEKPLPRTPSMKSRAPTPRPSTPTGEGIGLGIMTPTGPPLSPFTFSSRPASIQGSPRPSSTYNRTPPMSQPWNNSTELKGFMPLKELRKSPPVATADSAWRALHPPATHFRHVSGASPTLRPATAQGLSSIRTVPNSPLLHSLASRTPSQHSGSAFSPGRGHRRNKSTPASNPPTLEPASISASQSTSSRNSPPRKRGHVRCTSDPNEMISAHLAAEMDLATRLDRKLREVSEKLEQGRVGEKSDSAASGSGSGSGSQAVSAAAGMSESGRSGGSSAGESEGGSRGGMRGGDGGMSGKVFAKMEWDVLMGRDVIM